MNKMISASLMCIDPFELKNCIIELEKANIDYLHIDVMDGKFVPNIGLGCDFINALRKHTDIPLDFHLMVERPDEIIPLLDIRKEDMVSVHYESTYQVQRTIDRVKKTNAKVLVAINPATSLFVMDELYSYIDGINLLMVNPGFAGQKMTENSMEKAGKLMGVLKEKKLKDYIVEVDGNITMENARLLNGLGANTFVAGTSSIFPKNSLDIEKLTLLQSSIEGSVGSLKIISTTV